MDSTRRTYGHVWFDESTIRHRIIRIFGFAESKLTSLLFHIYISHRIFECNLWSCNETRICFDVVIADGDQQRSERSIGTLTRGEVEICWYMHIACSFKRLVGYFEEWYVSRHPVSWYQSIDFANNFCAVFEIPDCRVLGGYVHKPWVKRELRDEGSQLEVSVDTARDVQPRSNHVRPSLFRFDPMMQLNNWITTSLNCDFSMLNTLRIIRDHRVRWDFSEGLEGIRRVQESSLFPSFYFLVKDQIKQLPSWQISYFKLYWISERSTFLSDVTVRKYGF